MQDIMQNYESIRQVINDVTLMDNLGSNTKPSISQRYC